MRIVTEPEFATRIAGLLSDPVYADAGWVTGPGRSGAVAAVYASHILHIPFVPYGQRAGRLGRVLIVDTASETGATMRKAMRRYQEHDPLECVAFIEPPRVAFWYEAPKPQHYRHEDFKRWRDLGGDQLADQGRLT